jgi:hypothetical protein
MPRQRAQVTAYEFTAKPYNYDNVDLVKSAEVELGPKENRERPIFAQVDFVDRLYVAGDRARVEFGVSRAFFTVENTGPGNVSVAADLLIGDSHKVSVIKFHDHPNAVSVSVNPDPGRASLSDLSLPPAPGENRFARIATASEEVEADQLDAELEIFLDAEGLYMAGDRQDALSQSEALSDQENY